MLGPVQPTPFDLYFNLFGIPVRVVPTFWLGGVVSGWALTYGGQRFDLLLIWIACLFVSILIHEMGHAAVASWYGWGPGVMLYHFGGLATFDPFQGRTSWRMIWLALAGPGAGFVLYGLVLGVEQLLHATRTPINLHGDEAFRYLREINLFWGLVNLLPVLPLDGGRICEELCVRYIRRGNGTELALKISIVVGVAASLYFFAGHRYLFGEPLTFGGILFALLAVQNFQEYQMFRGGGYW